MTNAMANAPRGPRRKKMTRQDLVAFLEAHGYKRDRYGNYLKEKGPGRVVRMKLTKLGVRYERKVFTHLNMSAVPSSSHTWVRVLSAYFKDLHVNAEGKLAGWKNH